jgi:uncharacterized protein (UPF0335 family)
VPCQGQACDRSRGRDAPCKDQLKSIVERIERLDEERKTISDDIRDVYSEAKGNGFDVKALRTIVRLRKQDDERASGRSRRRSVGDVYAFGGAWGCCDASRRQPAYTTLDGR